MGLGSRGVIGLETDCLAVNVHDQEFKIIVDQDREFRIRSPDRTDTVVVLMTGDHQVYTGFVQDWDEKLADVLVAMPVIEPWRYMGEHDPDGSILEGFGFCDFLKPDRFLVEVLVHAEHTLVLDVVVRLVLTTVEGDEEVLAPLECEIRHSGRSLEHRIERLHNPDFTLPDGPVV